LLRITSDKKDARDPEETRHSLIPEKHLLDEEEKYYLVQMINELPETQRTVLVMHYFNGKSGADIAKEMHSNPSAVYSSIAKARKTLRKRLEKMGEGVGDAVGDGLSSSLGAARAGSGAAKALLIAGLVALGVLLLRGVAYLGMQGAGGVSGFLFLS
jgi:DNA-directed RNA polymerase subunit H (RpoH/RPB5)